MDFDRIQNINVRRDEAELLKVWGQLRNDPEVARALADILIADRDATKEERLELIRTEAEIEKEQLRMVQELYDAIATDLGAKVWFRRILPWPNFRVYEAIKTTLELAQSTLATHRVLHGTGSRP